MNKSKKISKNKSKIQNISPRLDNRLFLPPVKTQQTLRHTFRFQSNAGETRFAVTWADLLDMMWFAASSTTGYRLYQYVRLHKVEAWCPSRTDGTNLVPQSLNIEMVSVTAGLVCPGDVYSDTSMANTAPCHVVARPRKGALNSMWQASSTSSSFILTCPLGTVVDVDVSLTQSITAAGAAIQQAPAGATAGTIYLGSLDGLRSGSTSLPPAAGGVNFL